MGTVYLVGSGPGDPALIPLRGAELLARADRILADAPIPPRLLDRVSDANVVEIVDEVENRLIEAARECRIVVRLVSGDPFRSAAAVSEMKALRAAGVRFEAVPALTRLGAAPGFAGLPLPAAEAAGVLFASLGPGVSGVHAELIAAGGTLVLDTAAMQPAEALKRLRDAGFDAEAPVVGIEDPGTPTQRVSRGSLAEVIANAQPARGPAVLILGAAASADPDLSWFEERPLLGRRVVVTRPRGQARELAVQLSDLGAVAEEFPTIGIRQPLDPVPLRRAVREVRSYDWVVFTSTNGVRRFWEELIAAGFDARALGRARVACIGPGTAAAVERHGIRPDVVPDTYVAEALVGAIAAEGVLDGRRVLLPRAAVARRVLPERLEGLGAHVEEVEAYRAVPDLAGADRMRALIRSDSVDAITFTASSTVANFVDAVGFDPAFETGRPVIAAIGPITAATAREKGLSVDVVAKDHTIRGLVDALVAHFAGVVFTCGSR